MRCSTILRAALVLLLLASADLAGAQTAPRRAYTASELYLVSTLSYQSSAAQAALSRQYSVALSIKRQQLLAKDSALATARLAVRATTAEARAARAQVAVLERDIAALQTQLLDSLAVQDAEFRRERALLATVGDEMLSTDDGKKALEVYLAGGPGAYEAADAVLMRIQQARDAVRQAAARLQLAADFRTRATLALDARDKGRATSAVALKLYEQVVANDSTGHWDWVELSRLYAATGGILRAETAAQRAVTTAATPRDRSAGLNALGDILKTRQDLAGAFARYEEGLAIRRRVAALDPTSAQAQRDVSVSLNRVGDILVARQDLRGALAHYEEGLGIARRAAALDPTSSQAQSDVSLSLERVGDVLVARQDLTGALARYEEGLGIARRVAALDPTSAQTQREVSVRLERVGDILVARQDLTGALARYEEGLGIQRRVAALVDEHPNSRTREQAISRSH